MILLSEILGYGDFLLASFKEKVYSLFSILRFGICLTKIIIDASIPTEIRQVCSFNLVTILS